MGTLDWLPGWFVYLIDGDGQWANLWASTHGDSLLAVLSIGACLWMAGEYYLYAIRTQRSLSSLAGTAYYRHHQLLRSIFLEGAIIHVLVSVVAWWTPPYIIISGLYLHNAWLARKLNISKLDLLAIQEHPRGREALEALGEDQDLVECSQDPADSMHRLNQATQELRCLIRKRTIGHGHTTGGNGP